MNLRNKMLSVLYCIIWPFFTLVHPRKVIGRENIPEGGFIMCGNHTHASDPLFAILACTFAKQIFPIAKIELRKVPVIGWLLEKAGILFINRGASDITTLKNVLKYLKNGRPVLIYPEGTRVDEEHEGESKTGTAVIACRAGVPIVPIYVPRKRTWFTPVKVIIGEPFMPEYEGKKPTKEEYVNIADDIMKRIYALGEEA